MSRAGIEPATTALKVRLRDNAMRLSAFPHNFRLVSVHRVAPSVCISVTGTVTDNRLFEVSPNRRE